jgi:hypothetical protein
MSVHPEQREVYNWLDFTMIVGFMVSCMLITAAILSLCTLLSSYLVGFWNNEKTVMKRFIELGYQFAPVAMLSIIIGLGDKLFVELHHLGVSLTWIASVKGTLLLASTLWSIQIGRALLSKQGLSGWRNTIALSPGIIGSVFIGIAWWPAIFGVSFSQFIFSY